MNTTTAKSMRKVYINGNSTLQNMIDLKKGDKFYIVPADNKDATLFSDIFNEEFIALSNGYPNQDGNVTIEVQNRRFFSQPVYDITRLVK